MQDNNFILLFGRLLPRLTYTDARMPRRLLRISRRNQAHNYFHFDLRAARRARERRAVIFENARRQNAGMGADAAGLRSATALMLIYARR